MSTSTERIAALLGKRVLLCDEQHEFQRRDAKNAIEVTVLELSPSGERVKIAYVHGGTAWAFVAHIRVVEDLPCAPHLEQRLRDKASQIQWDRPDTLGKNLSTLLLEAADALRARVGAVRAEPPDAQPTDDEIGAVFDRLNGEWHDDGGSLFFPWAKCCEPDDEGRESAIAHIVRGVAKNFASRVGAAPRPEPSEAAHDAARTAFNCAIVNWHWNEAMRQAVCAAFAVDRGAVLGGVHERD